MKSDVILIDNQGNGYSEALNETRKVAIYQGLGHKESIQLQLLTEEMLSLARTVTGEMEAGFWIEADGKTFKLNMNTKTVMDKEKRSLLIESSTERKNAAANSFLGKLRDVFEEAMTSESDRDCYELPVELQADLAGRVFDSPEWDRYEQSVLKRLADNVQIGIRGGVVNMTVTKAF